MIHIFSHVKPDADAFGSAVALAEIQGGFAMIKEEDWANRPASIRAIECEFGPLTLFRVRHFKDSDAVPEAVNGEGVLWVVDCGDPSRISAPDAVKERGFSCSFDHHCNQPVAAVEHGNPSAPAASAVIAKEFADKLNPLSATLLYAGLAGDTELFSNGAANAEAFEAAALLARAGAKTELVNRAIRSMTLGRAKIQARFLESLKQEKIGGVTVNTTVLTPADFEAAGAGRADYAGMPGVALSVGGADLSASLNRDEKDPRVWRIAFRSNGSGRAKACAMCFNGNGHPDAAGGVVTADTAEEARGKVIDGIKALAMA